MIIHVAGYAIPLAVALSFLTSVLIPGVSALLARRRWPTDVQAAITVALALVSGFASQLAAHPDDYKTSHALGAALVAYLIAAAANSQFWRGSASQARLLAVGSKPSHSD